MKCISVVVAGICLPWALAAVLIPPPLAAVDHRLPAKVTETECAGNPCGSAKGTGAAWAFHGILGEAQWTNGAVAKLVIERFDAGGIKIRRIDLPNSVSYGLTAVYTGQLHGNRMVGSVVWSWNGHWNDRHPSGQWSATVQGLSSAPPVVAVAKIPKALTECEADQCAPGRSGGCLWTFHGTDGEARCRNGAQAQLVIEQFDRSGIVIRRTDPPHSSSYGLTALYTGTLLGDRITGYGTWSWPGHWNNHNPSGRWFATVQTAANAELPPVPPPLVSPQVHPDGSVTFRAMNPYSQEMFLDLEGADPVIMEKDELGVWSITTAPLKPDYYGYLFRDADVPVIDPLNSLLLPNLVQTENMVHVPGPASLPWELNDGPHGVVHHHFYRSEVIGEERELYVYTPPGYDPDTKTEYPVLYLLHGWGQKASSWTEVGFANRILDHLIDEGKAKPMIVVMPSGYAGMDILAPGAYWNDALRNRDFDKFAESLLTEVIPQVARDYHVKQGRDARAIAGLSMGGAQALLIGLNHLDRFAWVGSFSSGGLRENFDQEFPEVDASANARLHLLWVSCGADDGLSGINRDFDQWLTSKGIRHDDVETPGKHTWMVWRRNLVGFAPMLFR
jgi:enterochelin esterase family protein